MTLLVNFVLFVGLLLGWHFNGYPIAWLLGGAAAIALVEVLVFFPFQLWKANLDEINALRSRLSPRLACSFNMNDSGCIRPNTQVAMPAQDNAAVTVTEIFTWFRVRVEAVGSTNIANCTARLVSIKRGDSELLAGETPPIPFAPNEGEDALSKTVSAGVPEYIDLLAANDTHGVLLPLRGHISQAVHWGDIFSLAGDYTLRVVIVSSNAPPASIKLRFRWTLRPATSQIDVIEARRDSNPRPYD